jgi:hypothetical protein
VILRDAHTPRGRDLGPLSPPRLVDESVFIGIVPVGDWDRKRPTYPRCGVNGCEMRRDGCLIHNAEAITRAERLTAKRTRTRTQG